MTFFFQSQSPLYSIPIFETAKKFKKCNPRISNFFLFSKISTIHTFIMNESFFIPVWCLTMIYFILTSDNPFFFISFKFTIALQQIEEVLQKLYWRQNSFKKSLEFFYRSVILFIVLHKKIEKKFQALTAMIAFAWTKFFFLNPLSLSFQFWNI